MKHIYKYLLSKTNNKANFRFYSEIVEQIYNLIKKPNDDQFDKLDKICKDYPNVEKILDVVLTLAKDHKYDVKSEIQFSNEHCIVFTYVETHVSIFITNDKKSIDLEFFKDDMMFVYMNERDFYKCSSNGKKLISIKTKHPHIHGSTFEYMTTSEETFDNIKDLIIDIMKN